MPAKCPEARKVANNKWRAANRERFNANTRRYRAENAERVCAVKNAWQREYRKSVKAQLSNRISCGLRHALKCAKRGIRSMDAVGYSVEQLKIHLERQFLNGMGWENMGEWHIDHIVPLSSFDYETPDCDDFKRAWALTNLRPLWAKDNVAKGAKIHHLV